ncbi:hypothetical protein Unana1_07066 [Umbelopsis nana]
MKAPARLKRHVHSAKSPVVDIKWLDDRFGKGNFIIIYRGPVLTEPQREKSGSPKQAEAEQAEAGLPTTSESSEDELDIDPRFNNSFHECLRPTPLHPKYNKELIRLLELLEMKRHTNGENMSSLSYRHAIAALKAYPREITSAKEAQQIKGIGQKIKQSIKLFLKTGTIPEAKQVESDAKFSTMNRFLKIWGYIKHKLRFSEPSANRFQQKSLEDANKDLIDSCYTAFLQPSAGILRQVDILVAPPSQLYTTILGWTGSRQFERSLRSYAEVRSHALAIGYKGNSNDANRPRASMLGAMEYLQIGVTLNASL